ncbi:Rossmann-fold NAD(P)-binding domain-containing protein [Enterobacter mori]|uniref:hypothetical protein n=1 Tax=Enterobacter mori TaxID=539813 RepID=UPI000FCBE11F|nr:hypothetical protein [Enterobacter mori]
MFNVPGKVVMLSAYKNKTDIICGFNFDTEIAYNYCDETQPRRIIVDQFQDIGWRTAEMLGEIERENNFYIDKLCQVRMPAWSRGRVVLVGDAAYCLSPGAGRGAPLRLTAPLHWEKRWLWLMAITLWRFDNMMRSLGLS